VVHSGRVGRVVAVVPAAFAGNRDGVLRVVVAADGIVVEV